MSETFVTINPERLLDDLRQLREFGAQGTGVVRRSLTPVDLESRRWLCGRLEAALCKAWRRINRVKSCQASVGVS